MTASAIPVVVRKCASSDDVAAIEATLPSGPSEFHRRRFESGAGSVYMLAWSDGVAVGHVLLTPESKYLEVAETLGRCAEMNALGVAQSYRHGGVAMALIGAAGDAARRMKVDRLGLAVLPGNRPAIKLNNKLGFECHAALEVVDVLTEFDGEGGLHIHRDTCLYLSRVVTR